MRAKFEMMKWLQRNSLWLISIGLMLASSGLDGEYMSKWMPDGFGWLGYVLNTMADTAGVVIAFHYGRLMQTRRNEAGGKRKLKLSAALIGCETVAVAYSWFFSWRQLLIVLPAIEPTAYRWIAFIGAGFIPLLLAFAGYTQSLLAGRIESESMPAGAKPQIAVPAVQAITEPVATETMQIAPHSDNGNEHACPYCDKSFSTVQGVNAHLRFCKGYKLQKMAG